MSNFPLPDPQTLLALARHNQDWLRRWEIFTARNPWPGYHPAFPPEQTAEWQYVLEQYLPWQEFRTSLKNLGRRFLPADDWLPTPLQTRDAFLTPIGMPSMPENLVQAWELLPESLAGKVTFNAEELLPLFCSLADPPRFGTDCQRYPEQLKTISDLLPLYQSNKVLDLGCGVGLGTHELAFFLRDKGIKVEMIMGVTREPLEVWMATNCSLPHDPIRQKHFPSQPPPEVKFQTGDALNFDSADKFQLIICNGLAGGRFLNDRQKILDFLINCRKLLTHRGYLCLANHFHDGCRPACQEMLQCASALGWRVSGNWNNAFLQSQAH